MYPAKFIDPLDGKPFARIIWKYRTQGKDSKDFTHLSNSYANVEKNSWRPSPSSHDLQPSLSNYCMTLLDTHTQTWSPQFPGQI